MKTLSSLVAVWLAFAAATVATAAEQEFDDPALEARYQALTHEIRCPKCLNESIAESKAPVAADLRREVRRLIGEGKSDDEVKTFLAERYGEFVLYRPRMTPTTFAVWAAPFVLLALGGLVFWRILAARTNQPLDEELPP
ncbi:MAG TPA: cytochrome c-type biogenesis protein [Gammaproteobacteria bacterium]|nr:cytochrome c-type biogenesis protein [Gammaproteobacteria bacterium]